MAKVTSKLQVTLPKALAARHAIRPGDQITWESAGDVIRVIPGGQRRTPDREARLHLFDQATARQRARKRAVAHGPAGAPRGWSRDDLYHRGRTR